MYPRWRSDAPGPRAASPAPGDSGLGQTRQDLFTEPLPDLEVQLSAELHGASWAVVCFVPEDTAWCDWIYRALNGYPLPPEVAGRITSGGQPRPDCLSIFPDRRDPSYLGLAPQALARSTYLIVVCSLQSAHDTVVDESIRAFKNAGGEQRIVALVVDGPPDPRQGELDRNPDFEWLPPWLRWRCDEKGFCPADRTEPRIVDARRGYATLPEVRDGLFAAVVDLEVAELERLDAFKRALPELLQVATFADPEMPPSLSTDFPVPPVRESSTHRDAVFMIGVALVLIVVAVVFGVRSFRELSADEPQSALAVTPRATPRASRFAVVPPIPAQQPETVQETLGEPVVPIANVAAVLSAGAPPAPAVIASVPSVSTSAPVTAPAPASDASPVAPPRLPQVSATQWAALTRVQPQTAVQSGGVAAPANPASTTDDAVLLDEVKTLERRGDETMAQRRTEDALDLYNTALSSALEYANRKGANPMAKDQVVMLQRKLGMLQLQNASTAEARTSYQQARKTLLQLKAQGVWSRDRAKQLDELESRLMSLPRD